MARIEHIDQIVLGRTYRVVVEQEDDLVDCFNKTAIAREIDAYPGENLVGLDFPEATGQHALWWFYPSELEEVDQ